MSLEGRKGPRRAERILVEVSSVYDPLLAEVAFVENQSANGMQVATERPWELGSHVNIRSVAGDRKARARVVYCNARGAKNFVVGLDVLSRGDEPTNPRYKRVHHSEYPQDHSKRG